ncbi:MAG: response regulator transcription factor [Telmatospirillum sp.]|nr:response regulator transcription factor [Telmatospirillum sp.]
MTDACKARLILVDDDDLLRPVLAGNLTQAGYDVIQFGDPAVALSTLREAPVPADLMILDWRMPGMSGLELLQALRAAGVTAAALFFTSHNDILFEEAALAFGAVDFIDKTRSFSILQKRIDLILTRQPPVAEPERELAAGDLSLDAATHTAQWKGRRIDLTFGEFRVVSLLAGSPRDVTYREIYDALRGENFVAGDGAEGYRANVRALIKRLREKFIAVDGAFSAIVNYPGFGYRWQGE